MAAKSYTKYVKPSVVDFEKLGAHYSISSLFAPYTDRTELYSYTAKRLDYHVRDAGKLRMALGQARFTSKVTQESETLSFWVVHFGDHNVAGGVQKVNGSDDYSEMLQALGESFDRVDIPEVVRQLDRRFGNRIYSLRSLFRDEQRRIVRTILSSTVAEAEAAYLQLYEHHSALMRFITSLGTPMPREFTTAVGYAIDSLLRRACSADELDEERITSLLREAQMSNVSLDRTSLEILLRQRIESLTRTFLAEPSKIEGLHVLIHTIRIALKMPFPLNLWTAQNEVYALQSGIFLRTRKKAQRGDERAHAWVTGYLELSELLRLNLA